MNLQYRSHLLEVRKLNGRQAANRKDITYAEQNPGRLRGLELVVQSVEFNQLLSI